MRSRATIAASCHITVYLLMAIAGGCAHPAIESQEIPVYVNASEFKGKGLYIVTFPRDKHLNHNVESTTLVVKAANATDMPLFVDVDVPGDYFLYLTGVHEQSGEWEEIPKSMMSMHGPISYMLLDPMDRKERARPIRTWVHGYAIGQLTLSPPVGKTEYRFVYHLLYLKPGETEPHRFTIEEKAEVDRAAQ